MYAFNAILIHFCDFVSCTHWVDNLRLFSWRIIHLIYIRNKCIPLFLKYNLEVKFSWWTQLHQCTFIPFSFFKKSLKSSKKMETLKSSKFLAMPEIIIPRLSPVQGLWKGAKIQGKPSRSGDKALAKRLRRLQRSRCQGASKITFPVAVQIKLWPTTT